MPGPRTSRHVRHPRRNRARALLVVLGVLASIGVLAAFLAAWELVKPLNYGSGIGSMGNSTTRLQVGSPQFPYSGPLAPGKDEFLFCDLNWRETTVCWPAPKSKASSYNAGVIAVGTSHTAWLTYTHFPKGGPAIPLTSGEVPPELNAAMIEGIAALPKGPHPHGARSEIARTLRSPGGAWVEWDRTALARWGSVWLLCYWPIPVALVLAIDSLALWSLLRGSRRIPAGACVCGYDRTGLATTSPCPECGNCAAS